MRLPIGVRPARPKEYLFVKTPNSIQRMTRQRRILLDVLDRKNWHPTAEEVYHIVRKQAPRISLGTVYRNLDILSRQGTITKIEEAGTQRRYDGNPTPHYHLKCLDCGEVWDVPGEAVTWQRPLDVAIPGFTITGHRLLFEGYCARCMEERQ